MNVIQLDLFSNITKKVLVACEESQAVTIEFRKLGVEAYSCDTKESSGGFPEWHIKGDAIAEAYSRKYDLMIGFPPCTHLAVSGAPHFKKKQQDGRQQEAIDFFMKLVNAPIERIAIENPVGIMSSVFRKPDQLIQPYYFGDTAQKKTCLWLKNLPPLYHNKERNLFDQDVSHTFRGEFVHWVDKKGRDRSQPKWYFDAFHNHKGDPEKRQELRSRTFPGIARAMAQQWSIFLENNQ